MLAARKVTLYGLGVTLAVVLCAFLVYDAGAVASIAMVLGEAGLVAAGASAALMACAVVIYGLVWTAILLRLSNRPGSMHRGLFASFLYAWPARYIPGTLPYQAGRLVLAQRYGFSRPCIAATAGYEAVLQVGSASFLGFLTVGVSLGTHVFGSGNILMLLPLAILPALLHPRILAPALNLLLRALRRPALEGRRILGLHDSLLAFLAYSVAHVMNGLAFWLILRSVTGDGSADPVLAVGVYSLAAAAGVAVLFVPGGLGVREAVSVVLLSGVVSPEDAMLAAAATRGVSLVADVVPLCVVAVGRLTGAFMSGWPVRSAPQPRTRLEPEAEPIEGR